MLADNVRLSGIGSTGLDSSEGCGEGDTTAGDDEVGVETDLL